MVARENWAPSAVMRAGLVIALPFEDLLGLSDLRSPHGS